MKSIYLEKKACINGHELTTDYDYANLTQFIDTNRFTVEVSNNAGNYLCNHIFYVGLKTTSENSVRPKVAFIHIPSIRNIENIDDLSKVFSNYIDSLT